MKSRNVSEKLALSVLISLSSLSAAAETSTDFSAWLAQKNKEKFSEVTDQIIVEFSSTAAQGQLTAQSTGMVSSIQTITSSSANALNQPENIDFKVTGNTSDNKTILKAEKSLPLDEMKKIAEALSSRDDIVFAEPDPRRFPMAQNTPYGFSSVQADLLSDSGASDMTVCIIDSGYERSNPDLPSGANVSGTNNSGTGNWYQAGGSHGTHVAGTIAALENSEGIKGILPNNSLNLHIIKVFNEDGWAYSSSLVNAIEECQSAGAKVVNMSLGGSRSSATERDALQEITNAGVLLVAAAGNGGNASFSYPASYDAVVSVGAVDEENAHASFSQFNNQVELAAPGVAVLSTVAGDGRQGYVTYGDITLGDDRVVPQSRFVPNRGGNFVISNIDATVTGELAACTLTGTTYSCGDMNEKICVAERSGNQQGSNYPEIDAVIACQNAGAEGVIVYSNSDLEGVQNPFLVDEDTEVTIPTVSVNRSMGQTLVAAAGTSATLKVVGERDYDYYNGTSMASPHVAGVAALAWSNNTKCSVSEVREALQETALDLGAAGRDTQFGFGLVQAKAASDYMEANCDGSVILPPEPETLLSETDLAASRNNWVNYSVDVPAGKSILKIEMSGGSGDADLYTRFGSAPTVSNFDCRPYRTGNAETCEVNSPEAGTYYIGVRAYSSFSGVSLTATVQ